jgi:Ca2+-binding EF-hand superfamily protein
MRDIMQRHWRYLVSGLAFSGVAAATVRADMAYAQQTAASLPRGMQLLIARIRPEQNAAQYADVVRNDFFQLDANSDGVLNKADIGLHEQMEAIPFRSRSASNAVRYDLDGDGAVTAEEIRAVMRYNSRMMLGMAGVNANNTQGFADAYRQADTVVQNIMSLDADKDGKVSYAEAGAAATRTPIANRDNSASDRTKQALTLDASSKGSVSLNEFLATGAAIFRKLDRDGDGKVTQQELVDFWRAPSAPDAAQPVTAAEPAPASSSQTTETQRPRQGGADATMLAPCTMPEPSAKAKVVLLSTYETQALSTVTLGSQDVVVHAGRIIVEPGEDPLYVLIPTYGPTIWQFSGAVERIERLIMSSLITGPNSGNGNAPSLVGATGVKADRVSFFARSRCLRFFSEVPSVASIQALAAVRQAVGRPPDVVSAAAPVIAFSVPSGKVDMVRAGSKNLTIEKSEEGNSGTIIVGSGPGNERDDFYTYSPAGLFKIDPKTVIASVPAEPYEVYPQQAGLIQLFKSGALTQNKSGEYIVQKKMRFPAGLYGAHSVKFAVPRGVPTPEGDPGHSCVAVEEGPPVGSANCR